MTAPQAGPWTVTIPAPAPWLSANQRRDLRRQTPDRRAWRDAGLVHARRVHLPKLQRVHIVAELRFAVARRRDPHNYYPTLKALVDGLVDYGLVPDDSHEYLVGPDLRYGPLTGGRGYGEVVLTVTDGVRESGDGWLIWSHRHNLWWGPNFRNYTADMFVAGRYGLEEAAAEVALSWESEIRPAGVVVAAPSVDLIGSRDVREIMNGRIKAATEAAIAARRAEAVRRG